MALRYESANGMGGWSDVVKQYGKDAVSAGGKAVASRIASKIRGKGASTSAATTYIAPKKGPAWGKIALVGGAILGVGYFAFGRRRARA